MQSDYHSSEDSIEADGNIGIVVGLAAGASIGVKNGVAVGDVGILYGRQHGRQ